MFSPESGWANLEQQENNHQSPLQIQKKASGASTNRTRHLLSLDHLSTFCSPLFSKQRKHAGNGSFDSEKGNWAWKKGWSINQSSKSITDSKKSLRGFNKPNATPTFTWSSIHLLFFLVLKTERKHAGNGSFDAKKGSWSWKKGWSINQSSKSITDPKKASEASTNRTRHLLSLDHLSTFCSSLFSKLRENMQGMVVLTQRREVDHGRRAMLRFLSRVESFSFFRTRFELSQEGFNPHGEHLNTTGS